MTNPFRPLLHALLLTYYRAAARQINPMHPDAGFIAIRISELEDEFGQTRT